MKHGGTSEIVGGWAVAAELSSIGKIEFWEITLKLGLPTFAFFLFALAMKGGF
jgi:hypothetical protein